jgi:hypothetical protein
MSDDGTLTFGVRGLPALPCLILQNLENALNLTVST